MASKAEGSTGAPKPSTAAPSLLSGAFNAGGGAGVKMPGRARCIAARGAASYTGGAGFTDCLAAAPRRNGV